MTALCKRTELSASCLFYGIKCSGLAFMNRSCLNEAGNYPASGCAIGANTGKKWDPHLTKRNGVQTSKNLLLTFVSWPVLFSEKS